MTQPGRRQVASLCSKLDFEIDQLICSSLPRAVETAGIIAEYLKIGGPEVIDELCEIGERNNFEAEALDVFLDRVRNTMNALASREGGPTLLVVTHAGFIMGSIRALFDIPTPGTGARLDPDFTSLTEWIKRDGIWHLKYFNLHGAA